MSSQVVHQWFSERGLLPRASDSAEQRQAIDAVLRSMVDTGRRKDVSVMGLVGLMPEVESEVRAIRAWPDGRKPIAQRESSRGTSVTIERHSSAGEVSPRQPVSSVAGNVSTTGEPFTSPSLVRDAMPKDVTAASVVSAFVELKGHIGRVGIASFSPDGKKVATGGEDRTVRIWDVESGKEIQKLTHVNAVYSVAFSPNGRQVATNSGGEGGRFHLWDIESGKDELEDVAKILGADVVKETVSDLLVGNTISSDRERVVVGVD